MPDINKHEVDIENLFKQNELDLNNIKELYKRLKEFEKKNTQIKYIETTLANKIKKDYESLKRIILDENVQVQLNNKINETKTELNNIIDENKTELINNIDEINLQLDNKANLNTIFTMSNMGQDIREAMTGGSVAVVGEDSILTVNIVNKQVTPAKTSFYAINEDGNLIDRNNLIKGYYYKNNGEKTIDNNAYTTGLIEIKNDVTYNFNFVSYVTFWNNNKTFINGYIQGSSTPDTPTDLENIPQNGKYVCFSVWAEDKEKCVFSKKTKYSKDLKTDYFLKETIIKEELLDNNLKEKINKSVNNNYFSNKKITFIGDSITYGVDGSTNGESVAKPYPKLVGEILGCECVNLGIAGSTIAGDGKTDSEITNNKIGFLPINERYNQISTDSDYIIVFAGVNDFTANVKTPLGAKGDNTKMSFYGALKILLDGLIENYPNAKIGFITPLKKSGWYNNNEYGVNLEKYYNAIIEMCEERSIPVLDFFKNGGCYGEIQAWKNVNLPDGLHPTQVYYNKLSRPISEFIKNI